MANTNVSTAPGWPGRIASPTRRRPPFARRRRVFGLVFVLVILGIAVAANYGPLRAYHDARTRVDATAAAVEELEAEKAALQSKLGRLTEAGYLETLARGELTYARPGEDIYIVTGTAQAESESAEGRAATGGSAEEETGATADLRGPFESFLRALGSLF